MSYKCLRGPVTSFANVQEAVRPEHGKCQRWCSKRSFRNATRQKNLHVRHRFTSKPAHTLRSAQALTLIRSFGFNFDGCTDSFATARTRFASLWQKVNKPVAPHARLEQWLSPDLNSMVVAKFPEQVRLQQHA